MWTKTVIYDQSVKYTRKGKCIAFAGFDAENKPQWFTKPEHVKLYDDVALAVADARILQQELPVSVVTYTIDETTGRVLITNVLF